jgi:flagellar M-ring protein FliF
MNKNLTQLGQHLLAIWKQLGINQRISIVMATALVFIGLGTMVFWSSRPDFALLYGKLDDGEASKIVAALDESKIPYQVRGGSIYVPSDKVYQVRMQMAGKGIPRGE